MRRIDIGRHIGTTGRLCCSFGIGLPAGRNALDLDLVLEIAENRVIFPARHQVNLVEALDTVLKFIPGKPVPVGLIRRYTGKNIFNITHKDRVVFPVIGAVYQYIGWLQVLRGNRALIKVNSRLRVGI